MSRKAIDGYTLDEEVTPGICLITQCRKPVSRALLGPRNYCGHEHKGLATRIRNRMRREAEQQAKKAEPPKRTIPPPESCQACIYGKPSEASEYGYECTIASAMRCRPFGEASLLTRRQG